jgi:uncharacterized membrane protein
MFFTMLVLRLVHIFAAIVWGGGALLMSLFIGRGIQATGEAGQQVARQLLNKQRLHIFMSVAAITTVLAGVALYWIDSDGFSPAWMRSGPGMGFGVGAIFGLISFVTGAIFGNGNASLARIGAQANGKPTAEQLAQIQAIQKRIKMVSPIHLVTMILAMILMASARYFLF